MKALILVDIQNDFLPGGALAISEGDQIIPIVNNLQKYFDVVIATQDWHPQNHQSFASSHPGKNIFDVINLYNLPQTLWPDHYLQGENGAMFPTSLHFNHVEAIFRKGMNAAIDSYSAFYDNGHRKNTGLAGYLKDKNVTEVYLTGLAGDICVYYSALDSLQENFETFIIEDATRPVNKQDFDQAMKVFLEKGGKLVQSQNLMF
jgi:nicotinamidase/pyrazinamidase